MPGRGRGGLGCRAAAEQTQRRRCLEDCSFTMDYERWRPPRVDASQRKVGRNFNWIWYVGAAVWFLNAALAMYRGSLRMGLTNAAISAVFLAAGLFFRRQGKRQAGRGDGR
jgi:hypothetical protein